ncbi:Gamma-glutamyl hydrolase 2 [Dionaea muscipula]
MQSPPRHHPPPPLTPSPPSPTPPQLLSPPPPTATSISTASDHQDPTMPKDGASPSSSSTSVHHSEILRYLWIPFIFSFSKEFTLARSQEPTILLPGEINLSDSKLQKPRCPAPDLKLNFRPVIGILSHPGDGASGRLNNATTASYIAASYVKFVESAGARVIPLVYNEPREILFKKLNLVNGVLFTGGWAKSGLYFEIVAEIFKKILQKNDDGQYFPCYAICLGFELLTMIISMDVGILERFHATDQASSLQFVRSAKIEGTVFQRFPPELLEKLSTDCLVMQNHQMW